MNTLETKSRASVGPGQKMNKNDSPPPRNNRQCHLHPNRGLNRVPAHFHSIGAGLTARSKTSCCGPDLASRQWLGRPASVCASSGACFVSNSLPARAR